jgi:tetratricopeptide (TPR) repeat protein
MRASETALSLAISIGHIECQCKALSNISFIRWETGQYSAAQADAEKLQRLGAMSANLYQEAAGLYMEACCRYSRGSYAHCVFLLDRATALLPLCGMSGGELNQMVMNIQMEVHRVKSEYVEARTIQTQLLDSVGNEGPFNRAVGLLNIAQIDVELVTDACDVQTTLATVSPLLENIAWPAGIHWHSAIQAALHMREGDLPAAIALLEKSYSLSKGDADLCTYCLERLGDSRKWTETNSALSPWTVIFLVHSLKLKRGLEIHKALQFLGDIFFRREDFDTAISLLTLSLDGFTHMDVHRSRAECMLRLGDISLIRGNAPRAAELWAKARPLFKRSSQMKQVIRVDGRLSSISHELSHDVQPESLRWPSDIHAPTNRVQSLQITEHPNMTGITEV